MEGSSDIKKYDIPDSKFISSISIIKTQKAPETRCYFSADYSFKTKTIVCAGGVTKNNQQIKIVKI